MLYGALEAGGTKMVCAIGDDLGNILEQTTLPTLTFEDTLPRIIEYFQDKRITALGIGAFGPVDVQPSSPTYGYILDTPKPGWKHCNLVGTLQEKLQIPINLDTDVNCACLGEITYGKGKNLESVIYITIGTGIGAGICIHNKMVHGMLHPEAGHIMVTPHPDDLFKGVCPYHENCFEGMASGLAIEKRWGKEAAKLWDNPQVWDLEAYYIAEALMSYIFIIMPNRIILGGGVMHQKQLLPLIRQKLLKRINGYIATSELQDMNLYVTDSNLDGKQGILGCLELAREWRTI